MKKVARYLQIDNKVQALVKYELRRAFPWPADPRRNIIFAVASRLLAAQREQMKTQKGVRL